MDSISRELANRDLADIRSLKESEAFQRYWLRRLKTKREAAFNKFLKDDQMGLEERETFRQIVLCYDDLLGMMDRDDATSRREVTQVSSPPGG